MGREPWINAIILGNVQGFGDAIMEHTALLVRNPGVLPLANFSDLADIPPLGERI
jgi:hypothetical protein